MKEILLVQIGDRMYSQIIDGIIKSKKAAGRERDRESLPRLIQFKDYLDGQGR